MLLTEIETLRLKGLNPGGGGEQGGDWGEEKKKMKIIPRTFFPMGQKKKKK